MAFFKNLKRLISTKGNSLVNKYQNNLDALEYELNKQTKTYDKVNESYIKLQGKRRKMEKDLENTKKLVNELREAAKKALNDGKEDVLKTIYQQVTKNEKTIKLYEQNIQTSLDVEEQVNKQLMTLKGHIMNIRNKIDTLSIKQSFSTSINEISSELNTHLKDMKLDEISKLEDKIEEEFNISEIKVENLDKNQEVDIENLLGDNGLDEFKKSLKEN